jgi:GNAT superfamily N-acetyltransferase
LTDVPVEGTGAPPLDDLRFRLADVSDAPAVAALHADSWRRHYRGAYSDAFLDGDVEADRLAVWAQRLGEPDRATHTIVAERGGHLIAFARTVFEADPRWGALLDNLHVAHGVKRRGIGSRLMALSARAVISRGTGLYLWALEQNRDARAFYESRGGTCVERVPVTSPGGQANRLVGSPIGLRYAWPDPRALDIRGTQDVEA